MNKIKVIIKRPDEKWGHVSWISDSLENLQKTVEGNIETVTLPNGVVIICNEEGRIKGLPKNFHIITHHYINPTDYVEVPMPIKGTVIVCGTKGEDFADIPISAGTWKHILFEKWGNK